MTRQRPTAMRVERTPPRPAQRPAAAPLQVLQDIPFQLDADTLMHQMRIDAGTDDAGALQTMIRLALQCGRPKAAYRETFIQARGRDTLRIGDTTFTSLALVRNLQSIERVFPFVATCGHEMDHVRPSRGDPLQDFWWDTIKTRLLAAAEQFALQRIRVAFRLAHTATMRPGSGDANVWPIEQQHALFALLDGVQERIGVRLTDSSLMIPNKTTSGLLFPTETDFRSCQVCHRANCPSREAPFDRELWAEIQHD